MVGCDGEESGDTASYTGEFLREELMGGRVRP